MLRIDARAPRMFGLALTPRLLWTLLVIGAIAIGAGLISKQLFALTITGFCILPLLPFLLMARAGHLRQVQAFELRDDGLFIDLPKAPRTMPWSELRGIKITRLAGAPAALVISHGDQQLALMVQHFSNQSIDALISAVTSRLQQPG